MTVRRSPGLALLPGPCRRGASLLQAGCGRWPQGRGGVGGEAAGEPVDSASPSLRVLVHTERRGACLCRSVSRREGGCVLLCACFPPSSPALVAQGPGKVSVHRAAAPGDPIAQGQPSSRLGLPPGGPGPTSTPPLKESPGRGGVCRLGRSV